MDPQKQRNLRLLKDEDPFPCPVWLLSQTLLLVAEFTFIVSPIFSLVFFSCQVIDFSSYASFSADSLLVSSSHWPLLVHPSVSISASPSSHLVLRISKAAALLMANNYSPVPYATKT